MAADRIEMVPSGAQTASGASAAFSVPTGQMLMVGIDTTAGSTVTAFDAYLEVSDDGGTTWYEMPADLVLKSSGLAAENTVVANHRQIVDNKTTITAEKFLAIYKHMPSDRIRLTWKFTGTSITFSASAVVK